MKTVKTGNEELSLAGAKSQANRVQMKRMASRYPGHQLDVRQIAARQYVLLTKAPSSKPPGGGGRECKIAKRATLCHIDTRCSGVAFRLQS